MGSRPNRGACLSKDQVFSSHLSWFISLKARIGYMTSVEIMSSRTNTMTIQCFVDYLSQSLTLIQDDSAKISQQTWKRYLPKNLNNFLSFCIHILIGSFCIWMKIPHNTVRLLKHCSNLYNRLGYDTYIHRQKQSTWLNKWSWN